MSETEKTDQDAAVWLAKIDAGLTPGGAQAFEAWLARSTSHRVAFLRMESAWNNADRLAALKRPDARPNDHSRSAWRVPVAAAGLLAVLGCGILLFHYFGDAPQGVYATKIGQHDSVKLADGTRIDLNANTRLQAALTKSTRAVSLEQGQAYFDVVHDSNRPFTVLVGKHRITDIGTKFSVLRKGNDAEIVVKEGRVRIDTLDTDSPQSPVFANGGSVVEARAEETLVISKPDEAISATLDWRIGRLVFDQETLAEAADEFNRYNQTKIVVRGRARNIRVGGSFRQDNVESFASLIHEGFRVSVRKRGNEIIVSK